MAGLSARRSERPEDAKTSDSKQLSDQSRVKERLGVLDDTEVMWPKEVMSLLGKAQGWLDEMKVVQLAVLKRIQSQVDLHPPKRVSA
ncbi:MAG: hypothetical protein Q9166_008075 [cf. Caloplaca sp. 2 TL-2023]